MRLRLRTLVGLLVAVPSLLASVSCAYMWKPPHLKVDKLDGKPRGSALVKIVVLLEDKDGKCTATVDPYLVVVFPGSALRWRVVNKCANPPVKHLMFTQPKVKTKVKDYEPKEWNYRFCTATIATLSANDDEKNALICEVPNDVQPGIYKYNLDGAAKLDPDIEVRKGG